MSQYPGKKTCWWSRISYSLLRISVDILREEIDGASVWVALVQPEVRAMDRIIALDRPRRYAVTVTLPERSATMLDRLV